MFLSRIIFSTGYLQKYQKYLEILHVIYHFIANFAKKKIFWFRSIMHVFVIIIKHNSIQGYLQSKDGLYTTSLSPFFSLTLFWGVDFSSNISSGFSRGRFCTPLSSSNFSWVDSVPPPPAFHQFFMGESNTLSSFNF